MVRTAFRRTGRCRPSRSSAVAGRRRERASPTQAKDEAAGHRRAQGHADECISTALGVDVTRGNRWGRAYVAGTALTSSPYANTKVRRQGKKTIADLVVGDRVLVQARVCKADLRTMRCRR